MTTKFDVGDAILVKGIVESIYVNTENNNRPAYYIRIKGVGEHEVYRIRVNEDVMRGDAE